MRMGQESRIISDNALIQWELVDVCLCISMPLTFPIFHRKSPRHVASRGTKRHGNEEAKSIDFGPINRYESLETPDRGQTVAQTTGQGGNSRPP
jgi:hypothetical protein